MYAFKSEEKWGIKCKILVSQVDPYFLKLGKFCTPYIYYSLN